MIVGQRLKAVKEKKQVSNNWLSDDSGVPLGTVNRVVSSESDNPQWLTVVALARSLGVSLDALAGIDPDILTDDKISQRLINTYEKIIDSKNRWINKLFLCLTLVIVFVLIVLVVDLFIPNMGYIRF